MLYTEHQPTEPTLYSIHTDHLGTPMELAECDGKLAWVGHYRAWGKLTKASDGRGNPSTTDNPLRFQGQYLDEETGLHYNRHRYYDPETGRFTTQDPIGLAGGENLYMYAPNPTGWVDPLGLASGRSGKQARLRAIGLDQKQPSHIRGWIQQEQNAIENGARRNIRNPPGYQLAHRRGYESHKGFGYEYAEPQHTDLHKLQHRYDDRGRANRRYACGRCFLIEEE
ncbi:RHS domain-containing protein [Halomonas sp. DP5N14-9]|uniref:RHS repeat-associated core domain-containing protein n=1 Tax=Halomonas sp. DP5N14-9 TaxID=2859075 RepID=UPI001C996A70|nr:RHS repeat-associated core domain-containing protein [Halomonas sp. DP5N14-9]MBY5943518.1 RHS domain-containing protein [Halomonas sp. DP5N14-9]